MSKAIGYTDEQLATVPDGANLGLGCGNPTALASLKEGEVVLDEGEVRVEGLGALREGGEEQDAASGEAAAGGPGMGHGAKNKTRLKRETRFIL